MNSKLFQLNTRDFIKGFIIAVVGAMLTALYNIIQTGWNLTWPQIKTILLAGLLAGISYLATNLSSNSNREFLTPEPQ